MLNVIMLSVGAPTLEPVCLSLSSAFALAIYLKTCIGAYLLSISTTLQHNDSFRKTVNVFFLQ